jgi:protein dithiol oxidoreductase (disulfide-forming)
LQSPCAQRIVAKTESGGFMQPFDRRSISMRTLLLLPALLGWALLAQAAAPVEGRDYQKVDPVQLTGFPAQVVVTEYFSWKCPHCALFAPTFDAWVKALPPDVRVERVAVALGRATWEPAARAHLVLMSMNAVQKVDAALFAAIHQQGMQMEHPAEIGGWLGKQGVDATAFMKMYSSSGIDMQYRAADAKARNHRVGGIPTLVIDGRYRVAIEDIGQGREPHFRKQLAMVNELIGMARKLRVPAKPVAGSPASK